MALLTAKVSIIGVCSSLQCHWRFLCKLCRGHHGKGSYLKDQTCSDPREFQTGKQKANFILDRLNKTKNGFGFPGGGRLDPDRDLVKIPGGCRFKAPMAIRFRPKMIFRVV